VSLTPSPLMNTEDAIFQSKLPVNSLRVVVYICMNLYLTVRNLLEELDVLQIPSPLLVMDHGGQEL
jgi:hypothetical protein